MKYKVAIFSGCYGKKDYGGPVARIYNIGKVLQQNNVDFKIFGFNPHQVHSDYQLEEAVGSWPQNLNDFNIFWCQQDFNCIYKLNALNILPILGCNLVPNSYPSHALPYLDSPAQQRQEQSILNEKKWVETLKGKFWCSQSYFQEKEYRRLGVSIDTPVYRIFNPIDIKRFNISKNKYDKFTLAWVGKVNAAKGPLFLQEIAKRLPHIEFLYLSNDNCNIDFSPNVQLILHKEHLSIPDLLCKAHFYISTSITENQPCGGLEAMACGLPVIAFRTSGWPELITDNYNGVLVDLANIDHMVYEIEKLRLDNERRKLLGFNARKFVKKNFSFDACWKQYKKLFDLYLEK